MDGHLSNLSEQVVAWLIVWREDTVHAVREEADCARAKAVSVSRDTLQPELLQSGSRLAQELVPELLQSGCRVAPNWLKIGSRVGGGI
eukprot:6706484-Prymnesium_polylepis.1